MKTKTVHINGIGPVLLRKSTRAKHIRITVKPFEGVSVSVPPLATFKQAESVVTEKVDWIKKQLGRMQETENRFTVFSESSSSPVPGYSLSIEQHQGTDVYTGLEERIIIVRYPQGRRVEEEEIQQAIRKTIEKALREKAKEDIPVKTARLARKHGFVYNRISIKNLKTRWGSCSQEGNLNFNIHLMRLPDHLLDYVILHELAHTVEPNHSKRYWALLDRIYGNVREIDRELNQYQIQIY